MCPPRQLDGVQRLAGFCAADAPTVDALRLQLATLRCRERRDVDEHRARCEELLQEAVQLRSERRHLQEEVAGWRRERAQAVELTDRQSTRWGHTELKLRTELSAQKVELNDARAQLRQLQATAVLEDDPDWEVEEMEERCRAMRQEVVGLESARREAGERTEELRGHLGRLRGGVARLRGEVLELQQAPAEEDLAGMRREVGVLRARLRVSEEEMGDEAERLRLQRESDRELPRLRYMEQERKKAQAMLMQARWDKDRLQTDFDRVIDGLEEQRASQELTVKHLRSEAAKSKDEGEEMMAVLRENDLRIAELRQDQRDSEAFVKHLHERLRRLEAERSALRKSLDREAGDRRHVQQLAMQALVEGLPLQASEQEEEGGEAVTHLQARLAAGEARNAVLRLEVAALEPALASYELP